MDGNIIPFICLNSRVLYGIEYALLTRESKIIKNISIIIFCGKKCVCTVPYVRIWGYVYLLVHKGGAIDTVGGGYCNVGRYYL